jgi:hypothetical protein
MAKKKKVKTNIGLKNFKIFDFSFADQTVGYSKRTGKKHKKY